MTGGSEGPTRGHSFSASVKRLKTLQGSELRLFWCALRRRGGVPLEPVEFSNGQNEWAENERLQGQPPIVRFFLVILAFQEHDPMSLCEICQPFFGERDLHVDGRRHLRVSTHRGRNAGKQGDGMVQNRGSWRRTNAVCGWLRGHCGHFEPSFSEEHRTREVSA